MTAGVKLYLCRKYNGAYNFFDELLFQDQELFTSLSPQGRDRLVELSGLNRSDSNRFVLRLAFANRSQCRPSPMSHF